jgi:Fibrinogen beta and gamma chains, C-terminal globular domain
VYKINPTGAAELQVYCDMETGGGGWTKVVSKNTNDAVWNAYTTDNNPLNLISGTGGRNFAQFSIDPL